MLSHSNKVVLLKILWKNESLAFIFLDTIEEICYVKYYFTFFTLYIFCALKTIIYKIFFRAT